jgi:hypothetical protein
MSTIITIEPITTIPDALLAPVEAGDLSGLADLMASLPGETSTGGRVWWTRFDPRDADPDGLLVGTTEPEIAGVSAYC